MIQPFRYHCQKVLPLVYDDSLSYYELLCKVTQRLNEMINDVNVNTDKIETLRLKHEALVKYTLDYFKNLHVQKEIDNKLDRMAESGELESIFAGTLNKPENQTRAYPRLWKMCADTSTYEIVDGVQVKTEWAAQCMAYIEVPNENDNHITGTSNITNGHKYLFIGYSSNVDGSGMNKITAYRIENGNMIELSSITGMPIKPAYIAVKYMPETNHIIVFWGVDSAALHQPQKIYYTVWNNEVFEYNIVMGIDPNIAPLEIYFSMEWYALFSNKNNLYGYCRIGNELRIVNVDAYENDDNVILTFSFNTTLQGLRNVSRTFQAMSTDGKNFYYCMSNPNVIAVYSMNGVWERYINVGEYAGQIFIGELEQVEEIDGKLYIISQFYYDRVQKGRMGALFELDFKHSMPESYPHTQYQVNQREMYIDPSIPSYSWIYQDGSNTYPFANLHTAYFSACSPENNTVNIIYKQPVSPTTVIIDRWEYQTNKSINVNCSSSNLTVIFKNIRVAGGALMINGGKIVKFDTFGRSNFAARNVIFTPDTANETHYNIDGHVALYGVYSCDTDIPNVFALATGSVGVIHITQNTNKIAQTNVTVGANVQTINCFNLGERFNPYVVYNGSGIRVNLDPVTLYPNRKVNFTIKLSQTSYHTFWAVVPTVEENSEFWCISTSFIPTDSDGIVTVSYKLRAISNNRFTVGRIDHTHISNSGTVTHTSYTYEDITEQNPNVYDTETPLVKIEYDLK